MVLKYLETALQVADMLTKQISPKHFERLRRVMMGHENFDDMQARYVQVKASGKGLRGYLRWLRLAAPTFCHWRYCVICCAWVGVLGGK